jgi:hypothetical protein
MDILQAKYRQQAISRLAGLLPYIVDSPSPLIID